MPELLATSRSAERNTVRNLLLIGLALAFAAAGAFAVFYKHENHAPLEAAVTRVLTLPLHVTYEHTGDAAGPDQTSDVLYVVTVLKVRDRSDVPLFLKDLTSSAQLQGGDLAGRLILPSERERLLQIVPKLKPVLDQTGVPPLDPEQRIEKNTTREGYAIFLYSMPSAEWDKRTGGSVTFDFYHQDSVQAALPK